MDTECDVLIIGSGIIGATYAKRLTDKMHNVIMVEVGEIDDSGERGGHKKNSMSYQKDIDTFTNLESVSSVSNISGLVGSVDTSKFTSMIPGVNSGSEQVPNRNLQGEYVTREVGGMGTHWTCSIPRFHSKELPLLDANPATSEAEWGRLYGLAEESLKKGDTQFEKSIRHNVVLRSLKKAYEPERTFQHIPLAAVRETETYVEWSSANTVFDMKDRPSNISQQQRFKLLDKTQCSKLIRDPQNKIIAAEVKNQRASPAFVYQIKAKVFIVAAGAILTPQLLANSGFADLGNKQSSKSSIPNLGRYITERTLTWCQTLLDRSLITNITSDVTFVDGKPTFRPGATTNTNPDWFNELVVAHASSDPNDPLPIPFRDSEPQVISLFSEKHPWQAMIHRDAFHYGAASEAVDTRMIVDLRWLGRAEPVKSNILYFSAKTKDKHDMPQPIFDYTVPKSQADEAINMMRDMTDVASKVGGYIPGSEPQFLEPGTALHLAGTHRAGLKPEDSVVDVNSKVWNFPNLFLGGAGNIGSNFAANPTLTSVAYAIKSAEYISTKFQASP